MSNRKQRFILSFYTGTGARESLVIGVPMGGIPIADLLPAFHQLFDKIISLETKHQTVTCGPDCGACCRQLVPLSLPEAFYLKSVLEGLKPKRRKRVRHRMEAIRDRVEAAGLLAAIRNPRENPGVDDRYFRLGLACPFLEENSCSIHRQRPLACREYLVASDKRFCRDPLGPNVLRIRIQRNMAAILSAFTARLYPVPKDPVPLFSFLSDSEKRREMMERKWPARALFEQYLTALARLNDETLQMTFTCEG